MVLGFSQHLFAISIEDNLKIIPFNEKWYIRKFFIDLIDNNQAAHVLFFDKKPACLISFTKKGPVIPSKTYFLTWDPFRDKPHIVWNPFFEKEHLQKWISWKKYEHLFPSSNFVFCEDEIGYDDGRISIQVCLINKKSLRNCLHEYEAIFKEFLGEDFSPENFISAIEARKKLVPLIKDNDALLGIILGYGSKASLAFREKTKSSNRESNRLNKYQGVNALQPSKCKICPVTFMGDPDSEEVNNLLEQYTRELNEIWMSYKGSTNSLKLILEKLCAE